MVLRGAQILRQVAKGHFLLAYQQKNQLSQERASSIAGNILRGGVAEATEDLVKFVERRVCKSDRQGLKRAARFPP